MPGTQCARGKGCYLKGCHDPVQPVPGREAEARALAAGFVPRGVELHTDHQSLEACTA